MPFVVQVYNINAVTFIDPFSPSFKGSEQISGARFPVLRSLFVWFGGLATESGE